MALPGFTLRQMVEAGVHFGHNVRRWNPKMEPYIFGQRNKIHIINLELSQPMMQRALETLRDAVAAGGRVLFVGTKRQASPLIRDCAEKSGQYYVNHRWLGGMLTNWRTISNSIRRLKELEEQLEEENRLTKKEQLMLERQREKLQRTLGGIRDMGGRPDILVVIDVIKEHIAVREAANIGVPVIAVVDSNADPESVTHPIPGNDDASRAIQFYCDLFAGAVLEGLQAELADSGMDLGEADEPLEIANDASEEESPVATEATAPDKESGEDGEGKPSEVESQTKGSPDKKTEPEKAEEKKEQAASKKVEKKTAKPEQAAPRATKAKGSEPKKSAAKAPAVKKNKEDPADKVPASKSPAKKTPAEKAPVTKVSSGKAKGVTREGEKK